MTAKLFSAELSRRRHLHVAIDLPNVVKIAYARLQPGMICSQAPLGFDHPTSGVAWFEVRKRYAIRCATAPSSHWLAMCVPTVWAPLATVALEDGMNGVARHPSPLQAAKRGRCLATTRRQRARTESLTHKPSTLR